MRVKNKVLFSIICGLNIMQARAGESIGNKNQIIKKIDNTVGTDFIKDNKIIIFGKGWDGSKYCNDNTLANPETLELYKIKNSKYELAILCPGILDGELNVVSVFSKTESAKFKSINPDQSASRISNIQLRQVILNLIQ